MRHLRRPTWKLTLLDVEPEGHRDGHGERANIVPILGGEVEALPRGEEEGVVGEGGKQREGGSSGGWGVGNIMKLFI